MRAPPGDPRWIFLMVVTVDCRLFLAVMLAVRWLLSDNSQPDSISLTAKGISARKIQHNSQQKISAE